MQTLRHGDFFTESSSGNSLVAQALDLDDRTPLVLAAEAKQEEVCKLLLEHGAGGSGRSSRFATMLGSTAGRRRWPVR